MHCWDIDKWPKPAFFTLLLFLLWFHLLLKSLISRRKWFTEGGEQGKAEFWKMFFPDLLFKRGFSCNYVVCLYKEVNPWIPHCTFPSFLAEEFPSITSRGFSQMPRGRYGWTQLNSALMLLVLMAQPAPSHNHLGLHSSETQFIEKWLF